MSEQMVVELGRQAIWTALLVAGPILGAGLLVGILVSIFQVATSIQDVTLTFIPKIVAVFLVILLTLTHAARVLVQFASHVIALVSQVPH